MRSSYLALVTLLASSCWSSDWTIRTRRHIEGSPYEDAVYTQYLSGGWRRWDSGFPNGKLSLTRITDCSNQRWIFLNHDDHTFQVVPAVVNVGVKKKIESRDTAERRDAFGFKARHVVQTTKYGPSRETIRDGWYVELPFSMECSATGNESELGFAIEETVTERFPGQLKETRTIDRVVDISKTRLDPALFRIPRGYHSWNSWREKVKAFFSGP